MSSDKIPTLKSLSRPISPPMGRRCNHSGNVKSMNTTATPESSDPGNQLGARDRRPWIATPLDAKTNCIRVLILQKGTGNMPIICDMSVVSLDADPYYEVLSYVWGDPKEIRSMAVRGVAFNATVNLFDFLHCLRLPNEDRFVWADAICIDQLNDVEKSYQIGLMTKVYRQAKEAHIWFGSFNAKTWYRDIAGDKTYFMACELTPKMWEDYERANTKDLKYFVEQDGFKPLSEAEHSEFVQRCEDDMFTQALAMLDRMAADDHLYTYPIYFAKEKEGGGKEYTVNRSWLWIIDVIRWLLTRPWWTRVWTLQEAVLPRADPTIHAPPYTFKLLRLLNGIQAMFNHNGSICCKWFGNPVTTRDRGKPEGGYTQCLAIFEQRHTLTHAPEEGMGVPLELVISAIQGRKATEIRDHWYGIFGFLPFQWQEESKLFPTEYTTAELFSQCSKLLYSSDWKGLARLEYARRMGQSSIVDLPSWAIDLSAQRQGNEEDYKRWRLYNATPGTTFNALTEWPDLKTPELSVQAIRVGTVQGVAERILPYRHGAPDVLRVVNDWLEFYRSTAQPVVDEDAFWRAAFMDRNVQQHWMAKRVRPLGTPRLNDAKSWWRAWNHTNDSRDLSFDRKAGGKTRGSFHYRALEMNAENEKFFVSTQGLPGMGSPDIQAGDEIYAIKGCKSLVLLRWVERKGSYVWVVVGLCFVDRWMYGRAIQGKCEWETLLLY
ncbi:heterokaryon incompatibility protein-domain-containing protein [Clohesyomyces aquaticus]|uniref:Heterokaryon incompatibility protein-domain-containing protein n=1 Tax=Clohesyomyces aquaticus TaxID=1231657 RepID=A0A1Y1YV02_9PLEO|nr:heterokaryon incompatibility protein-domain-containing protein [Clohesyomyces aquaticus]